LCAGIAVAGGVPVGAAGGIAVRGARPEDLLGQAHSAMHQARGAGAGTAVFDPAYRAGATARLRTERDLRFALERGELVVLYQPLLDVASGSIVGAEALVRWQHPERGLLPPGDFLPVAEQTGQIVALGEYVLLEACRQAVAWRDAGYPVRISVNVAADQFRRAAFVPAVTRALERSGLAPDALCLEITESALMRTTDERAWDLERLRHLGVHLAIDDFGTGYSSLAYLHELPVDELKIDRSFVSRLDGPGRDDHLVEAIIRMARALTLHVVAEGVETDDQLGRLTGLGCPTVQGYLIARPQPPADFVDLVAAERRAATAGRPVA
jgi:EAL domain-containing protein (putative c-di-GMP-specific phosphodiesterase class I)